jgi:His/Glu/Gln/Arg/opine family amino acid ABC transporter permease subunit
MVARELQVANRRVEAVAMMQTNFSAVLAYWPDFLRGAMRTLELAALSLALGAAIGFVLALARTSGVRAFSLPAYVYIEFFRTTPPLVLIVWMYFVLPVMIGHEVNSFQAATLAMGLNIAAFLAEILRAGIRGVDATQRDAAQVLGLSRWDSVRFVVLPQALRIVLPPIGTTTILLLKSTSLASSIGLLELTRIGQLVSSETFRPLESLTTVAVLYFAMGYPIARLVRRYETRLRAGQH